MDTFLLFYSSMGDRHLTIFRHSGKKLPEYPAEEDEVLSLLERVAEAKKLSAMVYLLCTCSSTCEKV